MSRGDLEAARAAVAELAPDEDPDTAWRAALIDRYANARRFRPYLLEVLDFHAAEGGREVLRALMAVPVLLAAARSPPARCPWVVRGAWRRLVLTSP